MAQVSVRYIVHDVDAAIDFYTRHLGFKPGGWNRFQLLVEDLDREIERLRGAGVRFRSDLVTGIGGRQVLIEDPAGNPIELFEPGSRQ